MDLEGWERAMIVQALKESDGNQTRAAQRLGISRATMWRRVREWGLTVYNNPLDRRQRLLSWAELEDAAKPQRARLGEMIAV